MGKVSTKSTYVEEGVDPRLADIVRTTAAIYGLDVRLNSGLAGRKTGTKNHPGGYAIDMSLIAPDGTVLPNYQNAATFPAYEKFAQTARIVQLEKYPELTKDFRWGGYFAGGTNPMDLMHFDVNPKYSGAMRGGSWESGANADFKAKWGIGESNPGLRSPEGQRNASQVRQQLAGSGGLVPPGTIPNGRPAAPQPMPGRPASISSPPVIEGVARRVTGPAAPQPARLSDALAATTSAPFGVRSNKQDRTVNETTMTPGQDLGRPAPQLAAMAAPQRAIAAPARPQTQPISQPSPARQQLKAMTPETLAMARASLGAVAPSVKATAPAPAPASSVPRTAPQPVAASVYGDRDAAIAAAMSGNPPTAAPQVAPQAPTPAPRPAPVPAPQPVRRPASPITGNAYKIQPGDTLGTIAQRWRVDPGTLAKLNGITDPNRIVSGDTLTLTPSPRPAPQMAPAKPAPSSAGTGGGFGGMFGGLMSGLGQKVDQAKSTIGNAYTTVVKETPAALNAITANVAENPNVRNAIISELMKTPGGRTLALNTALGRAPLDNKTVINKSGETAASRRARQIAEDKAGMFDAFGNFM